MVYEFHSVRRLNEELFVVFSQAADDSRKKYLAVGMRTALKGSFIQANKVTQNAYAKVVCAAIDHDCDLPEQRLYTPVPERKLS